ncbi:hypothetical protein RND81_05G080500 [Saponaria officinalis]|uniref:At1g61320/AtMIF1 LRR domain-containing protein n=1 Tax=Saponaria officinalis TaxID=3572 RepID=A0AAW1KZ04_SAPOF
MLDHIIRSCALLRKLCVFNCTGLRNIVIPRSSALEMLDLTETFPKGEAIILENSSLKEFSYTPKGDHNSDDPWPIISTPGVFRNLRTFYVSNVGVTDEVLAELLSEFTLLEDLVFWGCHMLNIMKISSTRIKYICLNDCCNLLDIVIDAPSLKKFEFNGELDPSLSISVTNNQGSCIISVHTLPYYLDTNGFVKLKNCLTGLNGRNFLKISLLHESLEVRCDGIVFNEAELGNANFGPPCNIGEVQLRRFPWRLSESSLSAFINGLFWICHPDIISLRINLAVLNSTVEAFISELENMAKCWRHPLVEGTNSSSLLNPRKLYVRLRLFW